MLAQLNIKCACLSRRFTFIERNDNLLFFLKILALLMLLCYLMIFLLICIIKYNINGKNNHYRNIWEVRTELCKILIKNTFKSGVSKQLKETKKIGVIPQQQEGLQLQLFRETRGGSSTRKPGIGNTERGTMGNCCHSRVLLLLGAERKRKERKGHKERKGRKRRSFLGKQMTSNGSLDLLWRNHACHLPAVLCGSGLWIHSAAFLLQELTVAHEEQGQQQIL